MNAVVKQRKCRLPVRMLSLALTCAVAPFTGSVWSHRSPPGRGCWCGSDTLQLRCSWVRYLQEHFLLASCWHGLEGGNRPPAVMVCHSVSCLEGCGMDLVEGCTGKRADFTRRGLKFGVFCFVCDDVTKSSGGEIKNRWISVRKKVPSWYSTKRAE